MFIRIPALRWLFFALLLALAAAYDAAVDNYVTERAAQTIRA